MDKKTSDILPIRDDERIVRIRRKKTSSIIFTKRFRKECKMIKKAERGRRRKLPQKWRQTWMIRDPCFPLSVHIPFFLRASNKKHVFECL